MDGVRFPRAPVRAKETDPVSDDRGFEPGRPAGADTGANTRAKTGGHAPLARIGTGWSAFHAAAAARGDGMHPKLLEALERDRLATGEMSEGDRRHGDEPSDGPRHGGGEVIFVDFAVKAASRRKA